jgi:hypothetical protein
MSDFPHWVASEGTKDLHDTTIRASRLSRPDPITIPTGTFHAVSSDTGTVACGRPREGLFDFERHNWALTDPDAKCGACRGVLTPPSDGD